MRILDSQGKLLRQPTDEDVTAIIESLPKDAGAHLVESPDIATITNLAQQIAAKLGERNLVKAGPESVAAQSGSDRG